VMLWLSPRPDSRAAEPLIGNTADLTRGSESSKDFYNTKKTFQRNLVKYMSVTDSNYDTKFCSRAQAVIRKQCNYVVTFTNVMFL